MAFGLKYHRQMKMMASDLVRYTVGVLCIAFCALRVIRYKS